MGKTLNISTNLWKSIKNNETHLKTFTKQWQMIEINMSNQWKRMKQPKTALQKNMKNIENTLKESVNIMKNIEKTMETNVKIIHRLILSWGPFEAHLRFRWGYFESPLRLLLTASLDLYINLLLNWFWKNLRASLKTTKKHVRPIWVIFTKNRHIRWAIEWKFEPGVRLFRAVFEGTLRFI